MEKAISFVASLNENKHRVLVLGDMLELGKDSRKAHSAIGSLVAKSGVTAVVFVGKEMKYAYNTASKHAVKCRFTYCEGSDEKAIKAAVSAIKKSARPGDIVLLKGSRGMEMERITALLEGKA
jgi:UDP-N-acetylmuramoyl-tripeptide--D-alanyl-D-alanine ligase